MEENILDQGEQELMDYFEEIITESIIEKKSIPAGSRLTIRVDDVALSASVKKKRMDR